MPYESTFPPITVPNLPLWTFLFNSPHSSLHPSNNPRSQLGSFVASSTDTSLQFSQLPTLTTHFSTAITRLYDFKPGDVLACFAANVTWFPVVMWGTIRIGGVFSGNNPAYESSEMVYALTKSKARFVVADQGSWETVRAACKQVGIAKDRILLLEGEDGGRGAVVEEGVVGVRELCEIGRGWGEKRQVPEFLMGEGGSNKDLLSFLVFSSGTTGYPKAAMLSHYNVIAQCLQFRDLTPPGTPEKRLATLPFFYVAGLIHTLHVSLLVNRTIIVMPTSPFSMPNFLRAITMYKIRDLTLVPPLVILLLNHPLVKEYDLSHVTQVISGAAPLSTEVIAAFKKKFPNANLVQSYGMTETTTCVTTTPPDLVGASPKGSVGKLIGSTQLKIVGEDGKEIAKGEEGEIRLKGPQCIALGYLGDEKFNKELRDEEGWLKTGDWGKMDEDGWLFITERIKDLIKVKGIQVAPAELEDCLLGHPLIADSAVISLSHPFSGEVPLAFVVLKPGAPNSNLEELEKQIMKYVSDRKSRAKWIEGGVRFVDEIPKNPNGKILRRVLRERVKMEERKKGAKL